MSLSPRFRDVTTLLRYKADPEIGKPKFTRHIIAVDENLAVWQTNNMKVLVRPSPPDIRHSIAAFVGSKSSVTCPSDRGNIIMSRGFGGEKKIYINKFNEIFTGRQSRRSVKIYNIQGNIPCLKVRNIFYTLVRLFPRKKN